MACMQWMTLLYTIVHWSLATTHIIKGKLHSNRSLISATLFPLQYVSSLINFKAQNVSASSTKKPVNLLTMCFLFSLLLRHSG